MHSVLFEWLQVLIFFICVAALIPMIGKYWSALVQGNRTFLHPYLGWLENFIYRFSGIDTNERMSWTTYAKNLLVFNLCGALVLFLILLFQAYLPLNPQQFEGLSPPLALNVAVSFMTNTDWQAYAGERTLSYASQMLGLTVQNFLSASTGSAVLMALIRGITRSVSGTIGNFWTDLVRSILYLLLPLSFIFAIILVGEGVVQTFSAYETVQTLENNEQTIPLGPAASQTAIKLLGTNGGGFFNANSAHPFENPTPLSNLLQQVLLILLPAAMIYSYGLLIGSRRHALLLLGVRFLFLFFGFAIALYAENIFNPVLEAHPVWEGKEVRLGQVNSVLWAISTTATSTGAVNMMHESLSPLAGGMALFNMMVGEVIFGSVGIGLCNLLMYVLLTVFLCGLMVGRTPEYRGKKLIKTDIQWIVAAVCIPNVLILLGSGIACAMPEVVSHLSTFGPHGLTELLYAYTSTTSNNGSAFAGIRADTNYFNIIFALQMLLGRFGLIIPSLAIAGSFAAKNTVPETSGTLSTNSLLFGILLICVIFIMGGLAFLPALSLGPIVEHLLMLRGNAFPFSGGV
jgi:potassium-transporting ATPase potassium-binding subunit